MSKKSSIIDSIAQLQAQVYGEVTTWENSGSIPIGARPASCMAYQGSGTTNALELDLATLVHPKGSTWGNPLPAHYGTRDGYFLLKRLHRDPTTHYADGLSRATYDEADETSFAPNSPVLACYRPFFYLALTLAGMEFKLTPKPRSYTLNVACRSAYPQWDCVTPWVLTLTNRASKNGEDWRASLPLEDLVQRIVAGIPDGTFKQSATQTLRDMMILAVTRDTKDVFDALWYNESLLMETWFTTNDTWGTGLGDGLPAIQYNKVGAHVSADGTELVIPEQTPWWSLEDDNEKAILLRSLYERAALTAPPNSVIFASVGKLLPMKITKVEGGPQVLNANQYILSAQQNIMPMHYNRLQQMYIDTWTGHVKVRDATKPTKSEIPAPIEITESTTFGEVWNPIVCLPIKIDPPDKDDEKSEVKPITPGPDDKTPTPDMPPDDGDGGDDGEDKFDITVTSPDCVHLVDNLALRADSLPLVRECKYPGYGTTSRNTVLKLAALLTKQGTLPVYDQEDYNTTEYKPETAGSSIRTYQRLAFDKDEAKDALMAAGTWVKLRVKETYEGTGSDRHMVSKELKSSEFIEFNDAIALLRDPESLPEGTYVPETVSIEGSSAAYALVLPHKSPRPFGTVTTEYTVEYTVLGPSDCLISEMVDNNALDYAVRKTGAGVLKYNAETTLFEDPTGSFGDTPYADKQVACFGYVASDYVSAADAIEHYIKQLIVADALDIASIISQTTPTKSSDRKFPWLIVIIIVVVALALIIFAYLSGRGKKQETAAAAQPPQPAITIVMPGATMQANGGSNPNGTEDGVARRSEV